MPVSKMDEECIANLVRQVMNLTSCNEDIAAITLNEYNYDVNRTVGYLLEDNGPKLETVIPKKNRSVRKQPGEGQCEKGEGNPVRKSDGSQTIIRTSMDSIRKGNKSLSEESEKEVSNDSARFNGGKKFRKVTSERGYMNGDECKENGGEIDQVINGMQHMGPYQKSRYRNRSPNDNESTVRNGGYHKLDGSNHPENESVPYRRQNRGMFNGGRVFQRREPPPRDDTRSQHTITETPVTHNEVFHNEYKKTEITEEETFSWSGEPLVFTNSATASQTVDQLLDANDANLHTILSQYTTRPPDNETPKVVSENEEATVATEFVTEQGFPEGKFNWDDDWSSPSNTGGVESATVTFPPVSTKEVESEQQENVDSKQISELSTPIHESTSFFDPEDPEVLRRHIFQVHKRSKPPPPSTSRIINDRPMVFSANRAIDINFCASDFRFGDDELRNTVLEKLSLCKNVQHLEKDVSSNISTYDKSEASQSPVPANPAQLTNNLCNVYSTTDESSQSTYNKLEHCTNEEVAEVNRSAAVSESISTTDSSSKAVQPPKVTLNSMNASTTEPSLETPSHGSSNRHDVSAVNDITSNNTNTQNRTQQTMLPSHTGRGTFSQTSHMPSNYSDSVHIPQSRAIPSENSFVPPNLPPVGLPHQLNGQNIPPIDANIILHALQSGLLASWLQNQYFSNINPGASNADSAQVALSNAGCPPAVTGGLSHPPNMIPPVTASTFLNPPSATNPANANVLNMVSQQYILPGNHQHTSNIGMDPNLANHDGSFYPSHFYIPHQQSQTGLMMPMQNQPHGGQQQTQMYVQHHVQNNSNAASNSDLPSSQQQSDESLQSSSNVHQRSNVPEKFSSLSHVFGGNVKGPQHMNEASSSNNHVSQFPMSSIPATKAPQQATVVLSPVLHAHPAQIHPAHNASTLYAQPNLGTCGGVDYHSQSQVAPQGQHHLLMSAPSSVTTNNGPFHSYITGQSIIQGHYLHSDQNRLNTTAVPSSLQSSAAPPPRNNKLTHQQQQCSVSASTRGTMGLVPHGYGHHWSSGGNVNGNS